MKTHTTKRPRCTEKQKKQARKAFHIWQMIRFASIRVVKILLRGILLRPATWQWMMVKVPGYIEKAELLFRDVCSFLNDHLF